VSSLTSLIFSYRYIVFVIHMCLLKKCCLYVCCLFKLYAVSTLIRSYQDGLTYSHFKLFIKNLTEQTVTHIKCIYLITKLEKLPNKLSGKAKCPSPGLADHSPVVMSFIYMRLFVTRQECSISSPGSMSQHRGGIQSTVRKSQRYR